MVDIARLTELRKRTNLGMKDCKDALEKSENNIEQAIQHLKKRGAIKAGDVAEHQTKEGCVKVYEHSGSQLAVMVEINCETDFAARSEEFNEFCDMLAMHIAAMKPKFNTIDNIPLPEKERQASIFEQQLPETLQDKPQEMKNKIINGKMTKWYKEICLLEQTLINSKKTIEETRAELILKLRENVTIGRWVRWEVGKTMETNVFIPLGNK